MLSAYFNTTAILQRPTMTTNEYGTPIETLVNITTFQCAKKQNRQIKVVVGNVTKTFENIRLYVDYDIGALENDKIKIGNATYRIISNNDVMGFDELYQIDIERAFNNE